MVSSYVATIFLFYYTKDSILTSIDMADLINEACFSAVSILNLSYRTIISTFSDYLRYVERLTLERGVRFLFWWLKDAIPDTTKGLTL